MTQAEVTTRYIALDHPAKMRFLVIAAHFLTIALRGDYDSPDLPYRVQRLQGANELQHHISSELLHHDDRNSYPNDALVTNLVEKAAHYQLGGELRWSLSQAMECAESQ
jgi:hypothetical protein